MAEISTKPYLLRAMFEWCNDSGYTPYVTVVVDGSVVVPPEYVREGEIVLNVSPLATSRFRMGNDVLEFQARFGGVARDVRVPIECIRAIYARETGHGMAFEAGHGPQSHDAPATLGAAPAPAGTALRVLPSAEAAAAPSSDPPDGPPVPPGDRPRLTRVK